MEKAPRRYYSSSNYNQKKFLKKSAYTKQSTRNPEESSQPRRSYVTKSGSRISNFFKKNSPFWKIILLIIVLIVFVGGLWAYIAIFRNLPSFDSIQGFSQATVITDKDGNTLYKVFDQNRQYVKYTDISENLVHATIAAEDKDFWTNQGVDIKGIFRAVYLSVKNMSLQGPGGSTITQQLIKNLLLTNDKKIERKAKEMVLATRIDDYLKKQVKVENPKLKGKDLDKAVKEKILEMYMNYVFLGNNAYGVEAASNTYFEKKAKDLTIFESSVIAATYQLPGTYNPYRNVGRLLGALTIKENKEEVVENNVDILATAKTKFAEAISSSTKSIPTTSEGVMNWLEARGSLKFEQDGHTYEVTYTPGRKDYVIGRMFEDKYIDEAQLKEAVIQGLTYEFKSAAINIKAPHFVFWVQEFMKSAGCDQKILPRCLTDEELAKGGFTIKTTLDPEAQDIAEKSVSDNMATVNGYGANNSSLVYLDSRDGDVLAYVGSADYNNEDIDGKVDMVQQLRQPGSSIKPLVYTYGFMTLPITIDTPIFDLKFKVGKDEPNNNDGTFMGPMPLRQALGFSRNIPAIKMYFAVGGQDKLVPFLNDIGIHSYNANSDYGYPMSIGSAELKMMELANAYMHLSAIGRPAQINPILEIKGADGQIIYQKQPQQQQQIVPEGVAYLIWKILSDAANLPSSWVNNFRVNGLTYANKSGTTDMKDSNGKILPRDGWLVGYTPSKVAIFWAGNTQGNAMNGNAYGGWVNGKTFRQFFTQLVAKGKIQTENVTPIDTKNVTISKISGRLAAQTTPESFRVSTMGYINTLPTAYDESFLPVQVDKACMGKVTDATPRYDILETYLIKPSTFMPNLMDIDSITEWFATKFAGTGENAEANEYSNLLIKEPTEICGDRKPLTESSAITVNIRQPSDGLSVTSTIDVRFDVNSPKPLQTVRILANDENVGEYTYLGKTTVSDIKKITLPEGANLYKITVMAVDQDGGYNKKTVSVEGGGKDTTAPSLLNDKVSIVKKDSGKYTVTMLFTDTQSSVKGGSIKMTNGVEIYKFNGGVASFDIQIPQELKYTVTDTAGNTLDGSVDVSLLVPSGE